jgi:iron complex outermembrane recepter protein
MFQRTRLCASLMLAFGGMSALTPAVAQQEVQRIEITGSAIRRIAAEGALPVTTITREDIEKSGATTATELLQRLPSMQGFTTTSQSVNGGGGGTTTASLHGIGSSYTLVLLNGRRVAPFNTGSTVNLESIPLSAIERVEVLLDGASALYGSDAIGGVVNFILRKSQTGAEVSVFVNRVEQGGGQSSSASITKGFGDFDKDGFNVMASFAFERQQQLRARQRAFGNSGILRGIDGQNVGMRLTSTNSVPGNILLLTPTADDVAAFYSPYLRSNGACAPNHIVAGEICRFDFPSQVDLIPESQRMTGLLSTRIKMGANHQLFGELVLSDFYNKPTFASPAQPGLTLTPALYSRYVLPYLAANGLTEADIGTLTDSATNNDPTYNLRLFDAGGRKDKYRYTTTHGVVGSEGSFGSWDYKAALTLSRQKFTDDTISGYASTNRFNALVASGAYDPLGMGPGQAVNVLAPAVLHQEIYRSLSTYNSLNVSANRPLFRTDGGDASLALGAEVGQQVYRDSPSLILQSIGDSIIGGQGGALPFDTSRRSMGVFSELLMPLTKDFEVTGSLRLDSYGAAVNRRAFDADGNPVAGSREEGKKASAATWKLGARYQPIREALFRGSIGTGFKVPTLANITTPLQAAGVTSGTYTCPFRAPDPLAVGCAPPGSQYNEAAGGNPSTGIDVLKPERSRQLSLGFVYEPNSSVSYGADYWRVQIKDQISVISEGVAFSDPVTFRRLFTLRRDPVTGRDNLTLLQQPVNLTKARYAGIDTNLTLRTLTAVGKLTTVVAGTYILKSDYTVPGLSGYQSSLGKFGVDNNVVFRWQISGSMTLDSGAWSSTVSANYRSAYRDHEAVCSVPTLTPAQCTAQGKWLGPEIRVLNPATGALGARVPFSRTVAEYITMDFQTKYRMNKDLDLILGIKNFLGVDPPLSVQDAGGGNMRGYDGRYADPLGRTWTFKANYRF